MSDTFSENDSHVLSAEKKSLEEAIASLKYNRDKILDEKKKVQSELEQWRATFQGLDPTTARSAIEKAKQIENENQSLKSKAQEAEQRLHSLHFEKNITSAALQSGVRPEALPDVLHRAYHENIASAESTTGTPAANGMASLTDWVQHLNKSAPHLFKPSSGGGAVSSSARRSVASVSIHGGKITHQNLSDIAEGRVIISG